jgi:hypothetical protein
VEHAITLLTITQPIHPRLAADTAIVEYGSLLDGQAATDRVWKPSVEDDLP